jgi:hypothetical protein
VSKVLLGGKFELPKHEKCEEYGADAHADASGGCQARSLMADGDDLHVGHVISQLRTDL